MDVNDAVDVEHATENASEIVERQLVAARERGDEETVVDLLRQGTYGTIGRTFPVSWLSHLRIVYGENLKHCRWVGQ